VTLSALRVTLSELRVTAWDPTCWGKVEFCLTKLQALRATSSTSATLHLIDVLNAFGLFARGRRDRP